LKLSRDELIKIIEEAGTQIDLGKLTDDDADLEAIGADSLDIMNILLGVQEKTGVEVPDDEVENLTSANKILEYVNKA
jgi:acyl carrier protein